MKEYEFDTYCGLSCETCDYRERCNCGGCIATQGKPFHGHCDVAECAIKKGKRFCGECDQFPCDTLKRYSFDKEQGDEGARIENCKRIKAALVARARDGIDPLAYCGFHCDHCFLGQWCGGCRSDYNCCSYATICEGGLCPQVGCCKEKGLNGCWECPDVADCDKGYFSNKNEYFCKASALYIGKHGRDAYGKLLTAVDDAGLQDSKMFDKAGSVEAALDMMEKFI